MNNRGHGASLALLLGLWFVWGYSWTVSKQAVPFIGPFDFAFWRNALGTLTLGALLVCTGRSLKPTPFWPSFWLGFTQTAGFTALTNFALLSGGAGKVSVLAYTMPFWTIVLAVFLLGEKPRPLQWLAVALALGGMLFIIEPWQLAGGGLPETLAISAGVCWAIAAIIVKRLRARSQVDVLSLTFWQMLWGTIPLALLALAIPQQPTDWHEPRLLWALAYLGPLAGGIGWLVWMTLLTRLRAGTAGLGALAIPAISVGMSAWQLGEMPGHSELLGMLLVGLSLMLLSALALLEQRRMQLA